MPAGVVTLRRNLCTPTHPATDTTMTLRDLTSGSPTGWPIRAALRTPFQLRTYSAVLYLALAFPLGLVYFVGTVVGVSVGLGLSVLLVGIPLLVVTVGFVYLAASVERVLARMLLGADVRQPAWKVTQATGFRDRSVALVTDPAVWGSLVFVLSKLFIGTAAFTLLVVFGTVVGSLIATPLYYDTPGVTVGLHLPAPIRQELSVIVPWEQFEVGLSVVVRLTSWEVTTLSGAVAVSLVGVAGLLLGLNVLRASGWVCARWAEVTLTPRVAKTSGDSTVKGGR